MDKLLVLCDPDKNTDCPKSACYKNGGCCFHTTDTSMALDTLFADNILVEDPLRIMLGIQAKFQARVDPRVTSNDLKERAAYIRDHFTHCVQELGEMLQEVPFYKNWKDYSKMTDEELMEAFDKSQKEYIDAWHFFMNIGLALGMTSDMVTEQYLSKHKENIRRQDDGYDHTMKHI